MSTTELMEAIHAALAKHGDNDRHMQHSVRLAYTGFQGHPWEAVALFGDGQQPSHDRRYRATGASPQIALAAMLDEIRRPDQEALDTQRRNLAVLDGLPRL